MRLFDAHCHLQDPRLGGLLPSSTELSVVNGTREDDWPEVSHLASKQGGILPSFGLHPWCVKERSADWLETLRDWLTLHPDAPVGEVGLDRWIKNPDLPDQETVFLKQLALANELSRPVSIHCLKAWGRMLELLREHRPKHGFLLHSYGGSAEMAAEFERLGAYFSFAGYFLIERKTKTRAVFQQISFERLLIETDAPDQCLPESLERFPLTKSGRRINHPDNLKVIYEEVAQLRRASVEGLASQVAENFERLFQTV